MVVGFEEGEFLPLIGVSVCRTNISQIKWNFEKFLISKDGKVLARYGSMNKPESIQKDIIAEIERGGKL